MTTSATHQRNNDTATRYVAPTRDRMTKEQAAVFDGIVHGPRGRAGHVPVTDNEGHLLGPFALMAISPAIGDAVQTLGAQIRFKGELSDCERELATLTVAAHHRSDFEWYAHKDEAARAGLTPAQLADVRAGRAPQFKDPRLTLIYSTSCALLREGTLSDLDYCTVSESLGESTLIELIWLCGYYSMLALALSTMLPSIPAEACDFFVTE